MVSHQTHNKENLTFIDSLTQFFKCLVFFFKVLDTQLHDATFKTHERSVELTEDNSKPLCMSRYDHTFYIVKTPMDFCS